MAGRSKDYYLRRVDAIVPQIQECLRVPHGHRSTTMWRASNTSVTRQLTKLRRMLKTNIEVLKREFDVEMGIEIARWVGTGPNLQQVPKANPGAIRAEGSKWVK